MAPDKVAFERRMLIEYLESFGLVATSMSADGWSREGFIEVNPVTGRPEEGLRDWPEGFDYDRFYTLWFIADAADWRRATDAATSKVHWVNGAGKRVPDVVD